MAQHFFNPNIKRYICIPCHKRFHKVFGRDRVFFHLSCNIGALTLDAGSEGKIMFHAFAAVFLCFPDLSSSGIRNHFHIAFISVKFFICEIQIHHLVHSFCNIVFKRFCIGVMLNNINAKACKYRFFYLIH